MKFAALTLALLASSIGSAASITFTPNTNVGAVDISGSVTIIVEDTGTNEVKLTIQNGLTNTRPGEDQFIAGVSVNINPVINPALLSFTRTAGPAELSICKSTNNCGSGNISGFDIEYDYTQANNVNRFDSTYTLAVYTITGPVGFSAASFNFATPPPDNYYAAVRIQGVGNNAQGSAKYVELDVPTLSEDPTGIPEPSTLSLLGAGLAAFAFGKLRKRS
jgi:hypothetical protein